ncbi:ABC transporter ATP-binding protein [Sporosarcina thermotolerans]|uniref:ABC transporter ATP-binding protein n=1 Tax=Sporosarcina thermotolerans TaxID=633404 RepID=A0AAW9A9H6_9BACL|nr:ABC transporter ATP-binding protein [Sporosarcina thermotolerans]MDW0117704.1 ABC transporter ATP-binding protein [Sporosarcina thermotolerans]
MAILAVHDLSKGYKNHQVLEKISLTIDAPGIWALVGPNGVGKTTFLNVITNILPATSGTVELVGKTNKDSSVFKEVAFLQDNTVLFDYLSGYDHLKYICDVQKIHKKRIKEVTEYVGMESYLKKTVGNYSLGMKQHLLLAMALINEPKLLLLDEPLNGLDPTSAILMRGILLELAEKGATILLSSHNLSEIDRVTKQILFLKDGKLTEVDMNNYENTYYEFVLSNHELAHRMLTEHGYDVEFASERIRIQLGNEQLDMVIELIKGKGIRILDIQKEITGSEKLYKEIFSEASS